MRIPVYFCESWDEVTAVFVDTELFPVNDPSTTRVCYSAIGQHSVCSLEWVAKNTHPAEPFKYQALLDELRTIYERDEGDIIEVVKWP